MAFARPDKFVKLCKKAHLSHAVLNYGLSRKASDEEIYQLATKEKLLVLTINFKDFKRLVKTNSAGVFGIPGDLSNEEIDSLVCNFIRRKNPDDYQGKATLINADSLPTPKLKTKNRTK